MKVARKLARRSLYAYAALVLGPLVVGAATLILRRRRSRRFVPGRSNGHTDSQALAQTVEEIAVGG